MDKGTGITSPINRQNRKSTAGNSREDYTPSNRRRKGRIFRGTFVKNLSRYVCPAQGTKKIMAIKKSPKGTTVSQTGQRTKKKIPHSTGGGEREAVAATLYAATLLLVNKQRDRKGRAVLCSRFFLGLGSLRALCDVYRCKRVAPFYARAFSSDWEVFGRFAMFIVASNVYLTSSKSTSSAVGPLEPLLSVGPACGPCGPAWPACACC